MSENRSDTTECVNSVQGDTQLKEVSNDSSAQSKEIKTSTLEKSDVVLNCVSSNSQDVSLNSEKGEEVLNDVVLSKKSSDEQQEVCETVQDSVQIKNVNNGPQEADCVTAGLCTEDNVKNVSDELKSQVKNSENDQDSAESNETALNSNGASGIVESVTTETEEAGCKNSDNTDSSEATGKETSETVKSLSADQASEDTGLAEEKENDTSKETVCSQDDNQNSKADEKIEEETQNKESDRTLKNNSPLPNIEENLKSDSDATDKDKNKQSAEKEVDCNSNDSENSVDDGKNDNPSSSKQDIQDYSDDDDSNGCFPACLAPEVCITEEKDDSSSSFMERSNDVGDHEDKGKESSPPILTKMTDSKDGEAEPMDVDGCFPSLSNVKDEPQDSGDGTEGGKVNGTVNSRKNVLDIAGKGYVTDTMNELLGLFGEKVDESMKEKLQLSKSTNNASSGDNSLTSPSDAQKKEPAGRTCAECGANKGLKYQVVFQGKTRFLCSDNCFQVFRSKQKLAPPPAKKVVDTCNVCKKEMKNGQGFCPMSGESSVVCSEECMKKYQQAHSPKQACAQCKSSIEGRTKCLTWETMEFCNEHCLGKYQAFLGSHCACCQQAVQRLSLGKYCVRFGSDIRQFCSGRCLEEFKKGLKVCTFCQKDLSSSQDSFLAPVGDRGQFKDFCSQQCMEQYETVNNGSAATPQNEQCSVCKKIAPVKVQVKYKENNHILCSDPCIAAFRYANKINTCLCDTCHKFFDSESLSLQFEGTSKRFCSKLCMNLFVLSHRKIVPCTWCKVKKYNFDMIERVDSNNHVQLFCSLNCLSLFRVSLNATSSRSMRCDHCQQMMPAQYHLTMSDASIRNFCSYKCVIQFQNQFTSVPTLTTATPSIRQSGPTPVGKATAVHNTTTPVISSVMSLAPSPSSKPAPASVSKTVNVRSPATAVTVSKTTTNSTTAGSPVVVREVVVKHPVPKVMKNKALSCKPLMQTKGVSCKPHPCHKTVQTDGEDQKPTSVNSLIPIPVPIYVPVPVHMYSRHVPFPLPYPVPIPVPVFIPTTKSTTLQIIKQIKEIQEKIPENPFEAELLMMAEMVAADDDDEKTGVSEDTENKTKTEKETKENDVDHKSKVDSIPDVPLDLEAELLPSVTAPVVEPLTAIDEDLIAPRSNRSKSKNSKRGRHKGRKRARKEEDEDSDQSWEPPQSPREEPPPLKQAKRKNENTPTTSDANLCLKYMFGVNAWKHWVVQKNNELEKGSQSRKLKLFKTDLLQLSPDELNYSLCLFVKEVRKPNGEEYAPDSIYYLCLGIQLYLFENSRIDNIFTDPYYEKFTECLNEVVQKQDSVFSGHFVSRIEEEILWESKQLGAHSPHVLLNTLMYFNTKFFALKTMDSHLQLSFSHIMKHWRKSNSGKSSNVRCALLRYYPPANGVDGKKEKEYYEQVENLANPLRCPVKLYEFYLSKCPESVKTRSDIFYLYPERSCVPDSPVWYSTQALGKETVAKMFQRIKMVQDINKPFA